MTRDNYVATDTDGKVISASTIGKLEEQLEPGQELHPVSEVHPGRTKAEKKSRTKKPKTYRIM